MKKNETSISLNYLVFLCLFLTIASTVSAQGKSELNTLSLSITQYLSPHLSSYERREKHEQIRVEDSRAEIWRYESFERGDLERKLCLASRSILFGRLPKSKGVKALFSDFYQLRELSLVFYKLKTSVQPNLQGVYEQREQVEVTARLTLQKDTLFALDLEVLKNILAGPDCVQRAKEILSDLWISEKIMERREALKIAEKEVRARWPLSNTRLTNNPELNSN
ncbi:MAG: hypothetical protein CMH49_08390 [Myxococcales bacterium]|nr:hypothetical protein [Myxococcales bacterium]